jgi:hypothetical protein
LTIRARVLNWHASGLDTKADNLFYVLSLV